MDKCKYCGNKFKQKPWLDDFEKGSCFSCRGYSRMLRGMLMGIDIGESTSAKSKAYWKKKIKNLL